MLYDQYFLKDQLYLKSSKTILIGDCESIKSRLKEEMITVNFE
jgi:hypothetical protein